MSRRKQLNPKPLNKGEDTVDEMTVDSRDSKDINPSDLSDEHTNHHTQEHDEVHPHHHHQSLSSPSETNPTNETDVEMIESPAETLRSTPPLHTGRTSPSAYHLRMPYETATLNRPPSVNAIVTSTSPASSQQEAPTTSNSPIINDNNMEAEEGTHHELNDVRAKIEYDDDSSSQQPQQRATPATTPQSPFAAILETETEEDFTTNAMKISTSPSSILPKLRLNALLASDPALKPDAKDLKAMHEETQQQQSKKRSTSSSTLSKKEELDSGCLVEPPPPSLKQQTSAAAAAAAADLPPRLKVFMCMPCGIGFSSPSTLEAHQAYYCSHRSKETDDDSAAALSMGGSEKASTSPTGASGTAGTGGATGEPSSKALKTGKQYACTQCSYSADKKVSLNRHMRMHQSSPAPSSSASNGAGAGGGGMDESTSQQIDRYCSECDIRFNNVKTYRAHKQHYCSSRRTDGQLTPKLEVTTTTVSKAAAGGSGGSISPQIRTKTPNPAMVAAAAAAAAAAAVTLQPPPQPFLALPTNPILIIPYSLIRAASLIPGPLTTASSGIVNPENTCFTLDNGALKPLATALSMGAGANSAATVPKTTVGINSTNSINSANSGNGHQIPIVDSTRQQQQHIVTESMMSLLTEKIAAGRNAESVEVTPKRNECGGTRETTTPLDLSLTRRSPLAAVLQRQRIRSACASFFDSEQQRFDMETLLEASKENLSMDDSGGSVTPEQIVCAPSLPNSPSMSPSPKRRAISPRSCGAGSTSSMSPPASTTTSSTTAALAAAAAAGNILDHLPLRSMLPTDIALKLSESNIMNPLLAKQNLELALKLSAAAAAAVSSSTSSLPTSHTGTNSIEFATATGKSSVMGLPVLQNSGGGGGGVATAGASGVAAGQPQIYVKQGVSKCKECNIVFCKYENYLAHKQHYCSSRNQDVSNSGGGDGGDSKLSGTPPMAAGPNTTDTTPVAYQQLICAACGIKYTSLDNLRAHQNYYCPKGGGGGVAAAAAAAAAATAKDAAQHSLQKEKCSKCKTTHEVGLPCPPPSALQQQQASHLISGSSASITNASSSNHNVYKCPVCDVVSLTVSESRKHLETHGSVKAFRCSICRYKGNTLRGMRTHIRMHFDKKTTDFNEEHYMSCILEDDGLEIPSVATMSQEQLVQQLAAVQQQQQQLQQQQLQQQQQQQVFNCDICNYSSSYKGNVLRHMKLVHPHAIINSPSISPESGDCEGDTANSFNGAGDNNSHSFSIKTEPMDSANIKTPTRSISSLGNLHENNNSPIPSMLAATNAGTNHFMANIKSEPIDISMESTHHSGQPPPLNSPSSLVIGPPPPLNATPDENSTPPVTAPMNQKYCEVCDIPFNYMKTYLAHKQFYCKNKTRRPEAAAHRDSPSPNTAILPTGLHSPSAAAMMLQKNKENLQQEAAI